jgi:endonuclease G
MPFNGHLKTSDLLDLVKAAADGDLLDVDRTLHLQGIARPFVLALRRHSSPLDQFQLDLDAVNRVERLANGEVPLVQLLTNAAWQLRLRGRKEAEVFERFANLVGNRTRGIGDLPEPSQLPEVVKEEAIIGQDDMVDFAFLHRGASVGRSVARILVPRFENNQAVTTARGAPWIMNGTAWLVAPKLAMTNHHVINARQEGEPPAAPADFLRQGQESIL